MTYAFRPPIIRETLITTMVRDAARCWRGARDENRSVMPCLTETLRISGNEMLAPVFASLLGICEAAFVRPLAVGSGPSLSEDETRLSAWLADGHGMKDSGPPSDPNGLLATAIRSTRIMLAMVGL
jgi:hypothetical protein